MTRREAREQAFCIIFERMFKDEPINDIVALAVESRDIEPDPYAMKVVNGVFDHLAEIDEIIKTYSIRWDKDRLSKVITSILRLTIFEIYYINSVPINVSINEAVELAKKFGGDGDSGFVNGLLGTVTRSDIFKNDEKIKEKIKNTKKAPKVK